MVMVIVHGVTLYVVRGMALNEPSIVIGTTGNLNSDASINAPRLNGIILPSQDLDPSGNISNDIPFFKRFSASEIVCFIPWRFESSTKT